MSTLKKKRYNISQCALYKCKNKRRLINLLQISQEELSNLEKIIEYYSFTRDKKDGDKRLITAPANRLKKIQKRILYLLAYVERPEWLISGERGKCYIDNARFHQNSDYFLTVDIRKFYDNCTREYVYCFFRDSMCTSNDVAAVLTDIITLERKIPTGCPTSQIIAYYAYQEMFENINKIAHKHGCIFTLYVDDMTFSSSGAFNPDRLKSDIDIELRKYGHKPKYSKVKYYSKVRHKLITGVVVSKDHTLLVANNLHKKIYDGAMQIKNMDDFSVANQANNIEKDIIALKGQLQAARNVDARIFPEITRLVENKIVDMAKLKETYILNS